MSSPDISGCYCGCSRFSRRTVTSVGRKRPGPSCKDPRATIRKPCAGDCSPSIPWRSRNWVCCSGAADSCSRVLRGQLDALRLLFPTDGSTSAANVYRDSIGGRAMNSLIAEAVASIAGSLPDGRCLRILEIGAGTGATTESILERIPAGRFHYTFTDIAASFLPSAKERFRGSQGIEFRVLDIERDPIASGICRTQLRRGDRRQRVACHRGLAAFVNARSSLDGAGRETDRPRGDEAGTLA